MDAIVPEVVTSVETRDDVRPHYDRDNDIGGRGTRVMCVGYTGQSWTWRNESGGEHERMEFMSIRKRKGKEKDKYDEWLAKAHSENRKIIRIARLEMISKFDKANNELAEELEKADATGDFVALEDAKEEHRASRLAAKKEYEECLKQHPVPVKVEQMD